MHGRSQNASPGTRMHTVRGVGWKNGQPGEGGEGGPSRVQGAVIRPLTPDRAGRGRCAVVWWPPGRLKCLLLIELATVARLRMQGSKWSVPSLLVRNQVILICCIACGSRPYCESRRDNMRVSRCANGMCARTDAPNCSHSTFGDCTLQEAS